VSGLLRRIRAWFADLSSRERTLVSAVGACALALILFVGLIQPALSASSRASGRVAAAESELEAVQRLHSRFAEVDGRVSAVERRIREGVKGEIFTTLETLAGQSAVKVASMEPRTSPASDDYRETKVQVALKGVSLAQLVNYLHRIETADQLLSIKSLRVKTRQQKEELLDVTFTVSSFEPIES